MSLAYPHGDGRSRRRQMRPWYLLALLQRRPSRCVFSTSDPVACFALPGTSCLKVRILRRVGVAIGAMRFCTVGAAHPPLRRGVSAIILVCAEEQVARIHTLTVIAAVTDQYPCWD